MGHSSSSKITNNPFQSIATTVMNDSSKHEESKDKDDSENQISSISENQGKSEDLYNSHTKKYNIEVIKAS